MITFLLTSPAVGGPDRPLSNRQLAQQRAEAEQERRRDNASSSMSPAAQYQSYPGQTDTQAEEGWGAWASRQLNERTEKLNIVGDSMDNLSQNSAGWANDVNKFVGKQKRGFVMGAMKSKFGL